MLSTGLLSEHPAEFARKYHRRWLVSNYEAGDVVFHKPHTVRTNAEARMSEYTDFKSFKIHASTINNDPDNVIRLATDLRFVDSSRSYDTVYSPSFQIGRAHV